MKTALDAIAENLYRARLGEARRTFDQQVAIRQDRHQQALDQTLLADNPGTDGGLQIQYFLL